MPQRMAPTGEKHFFGYYLTEKKLLLVEKGGFLQGLLPGLPGRPRPSCWRSCWPG